MADKTIVSIDEVNTHLPQLVKDLGAIGPAGETIYAPLVAIHDGGYTITTDGTTTATLGAGTATIGKLGANSGVDIGDVTLNGPLGQAAMAASLPVVVASDQSNVPVKLAGSTQTLLAATTIATDATTAYAAVTGLDIYSRCVVQLIVSGKVMDASTTLNIYIQRSVDGGTNWDDIGSFAQVTSAAIADGTYYMGLALSGVSQVDRIKADGTLTANTVASFTSWGDRLRVKKISANFAGSDTITIALTAYMIP